MLNKKQKMMVAYNDSLVTIAGPGSGKTHTLTEKIYHISKKNDISRILLLTFTNSAASEIKERVLNRLDNTPHKELYFGTYHSIFKRILLDLKIFEKIDFGNSPTIITPNEITRLFSNQIKNYLKTKELFMSIDAISNYTEETADEKDINKLTKTIITKELINSKNILNIIDNKINFISAEEVKGFNNVKDFYFEFKNKIKELLLEEIRYSIDMEKSDSYCFGSTFIEYVKMDNYEMTKTSQIIDDLLSSLFNTKLEEQVITFSDILLLTLFSLLKVDKFKEHVSNYFDYIYIDEFQDTNIIQYNILKEIYNPLKNKLQVIGDPYQSIFSFIGAEVKNILNVKKDLNTKLLQLDTNYRSNANIVELTNYLSQKMDEKIEGLKPCFSARDDIKNHKIKIHVNFNKYDKFSDSSKQRNFMLEKIKKYLKKGKTIGIINRTSKDYKSENVLIQEKIKFSKLGGISLKESLEIQILIHMFKYSINPEKVSSFIYILENIKGIGERTIENFLYKKKSNPKIDYVIKWFEKLKDLDFNKKRNELLKFYKNQLFPNLSRQWKEDRIDTALVRLDFLIEEINEKDNEIEIQNLLDNYLMDDTTEKENTEDVVISTIHSAKGLEWDVVFLTDWNNESFKRDLENNPGEGQRLNYVAVSRAKEKLYMLSDVDDIYCLNDNDFYMNQHLFDLTNHMNQSFQEMYEEESENIEDYVNFGKFKKVKFKNMPKYYLNYLLDNSIGLIEDKKINEFQIEMIEEILGYK